MKAVVIGKYGGNEVVEIRDLPVPAPGQGEVLIRVCASSVNPLDWKIRSGMLRMFTGRSFPKVLGSECAGEVAGFGSGVQRFRRDDRVIAFSGVRRLGAFAEYICVKEKTVFPLPAAIGFEEASTIPIAGLTALQALRDLGHISAGSTVLINGASGGVGHFAVQIAKIFGAQVTAVCSGPNAGLVKSLGADMIIDYTQENFTESGGQYDVIFDAVSKRSFSDCKRALTHRGVYISTLPSAPVLLNQYLTGILAGRKAKTVMVRPNATDMEWMKDHIKKGLVRVVIDRVFTLEQIRDALAYAESGRVRGKVVLTVGRPQAALHSTALSDSPGN